MESVQVMRVPTLILQGKEEGMGTTDYASAINTAFDEAGNKAHKLVYFDNVERFFGLRVVGGINKIYYAVDPSVADIIKSWINQVLVEAAAQAPETVPPVPETASSTQDRPK
jgi:hypothetical protein